MILFLNLSFVGQLERLNLFAFLLAGLFSVSFGATEVFWKFELSNFNHFQLRLHLRLFSFLTLFFILRNLVWGNSDVV